MGATPIFTSEPETPITPNVVSMFDATPSSATEILGQALRHESNVDGAHEEARALLELAGVIHTLLCASSDDSAIALASVGEDSDAAQLKLLCSKLLPLTERVVLQLDGERQRRVKAERVAVDAKAEEAKVQRKLELYKRQLQCMAESSEVAERTAAERAATEGVNAAERIKAEKEEVRLLVRAWLDTFTLCPLIFPAPRFPFAFVWLFRGFFFQLRHSLGACIEQLAAEKAIAEKRAAVAEAALRAESNLSGSGDGSAVGRTNGNSLCPSTPLGASKPATAATETAAKAAVTLGRWTDFLGEEVAREAAESAVRWLPSPRNGHDVAPPGSASVALALPAASPSLAPTHSPDADHGGFTPAAHDEGGVVPDGLSCEEQTRQDGWPCTELLTPSPPRTVSRLQVEEQEAVASFEADAAGEPQARERMAQLDDPGEVRNEATATDEENCSVGGSDSSSGWSCSETGDALRVAADASMQAAIQHELDVRAEVEANEVGEAVAAAVTRAVTAAPERPLETAPAAELAQAPQLSRQPTAATPPPHAPLAKSHELPPEAADADAEAEVAEAAEKEDEDALLNVQIRAIMMQHAEDCKRMSHADAGRFAMEALRGVHVLRQHSHHP